MPSGPFESMPESLRAFFDPQLKSTIKVTLLICPAPYTLLVVITLAACISWEESQDKEQIGRKGDEAHTQQGPVPGVCSISSTDPFAKMNKSLIVIASDTDIIVMEESE